MAEFPIDILLRAKDQASRTIGSLEKRLGNLGRIGGKAMRNLTTNMLRIGAVGAGALAGGVILGARSLEELERISNQTAAVIASTGGVAGQTSDSIRAMAQELENLTTADDKAIQGGQNLLLTFTQIGKDVFPDASKAMVNLAIAMAEGDVAAADFKGTALQIGKALNDPIRGITALRRAGVSFTKQQEDQIKTLVKSGRTVEAQRMILAELEVQFGQAGAAAGKGFGADIRRMEDAVEDASQALARGFLPVISRASQWISRKMADPKVLAALDELGNELAQLADGALKFIEGMDFKAIGAGLSAARDAAKAIVGAFMSLPPWVQQAVVTGWGLNKLTGGALGDLVGELGKGLVKGVLGMTAGVVHINAGSVNGGGMPGVGGKGPGGGALGMAARVVVPLAVGFAIAEAVKQASGQSESDWRSNVASSYSRMGGGKPVRLTTPVEQAAIDAAKAAGSTHAETIATNRALAGLKTAEQNSLVAFRAGERTTSSGLASVRNAINAKNFSPTVRVGLNVQNFVSNQSMTTGQQTYSKFSYSVR